MLNNFCFHVYAQKSLSHFHTLSLSHSHTLTLSHSCTLALSHSHTLSFTLFRHAEQLLFSCLGSKVTLSLSHSHTLALSHSFNLSFNHSRHAEQVLFSSLWVAVYSRKLQCFFFDLIILLTLTLSHSFSLSHSFNLSFNHSRHAEQVLFSFLCSEVTIYRWKWQCVFLDFRSSTLSCEFRVHWAGSQLKSQKKLGTTFGSTWT